MATAQPAGRSRREARARIQTAATTLFHRDRIGSHRGGAANRTRQRVETHVLLALLRMNELVQEYLRRIHHAGRVPTEQAIDAADGSPRSRPLALDSTPGGRSFHNAAVRAGRNVNLPVCLMP
jgi:hypothetical protein